MDPLLKLNDYVWGEDLTKLNCFNFSTVYDHYTKDNSSARLIKSGYQLFVSSYYKDVFTSYNEATEAVLVKAKCYPTMRKSDPPKALFFEIHMDEQLVTDSYCTCKAGKDKCIHMVGLFHLINHYVMLGLSRVPDEKTCTMMEQEWHKPRGTKIEAEAVMESTFAKPNPKRKRGPEMCSFKKLDTLPTEEEITSFIKTIKLHAPKSAMATIVKNEVRLVQTSMGSVPLGSTLAHQLQTFDPIKVDGGENCPHLPISTSNFEVTIEWSQDLTLTIQEAISLEKQTKDQSNNLWHDARKCRITSSNFGLICKRKKVMTKEFIKTIYEGSDLSKVKSIRYGKKNEKKAKDKYRLYMKDNNTEIELYPAGFIVNPSFPFLGSTPDGVVIDKSETEVVGLVEIKCPISKQTQTLEIACADNKFYLELRDGIAHLKETSLYYHQVQGQMIIANVKWCDFVVFNGNDIWVERVRRNDDFCKAMLSLFYINHFQPYVKGLTRKPPTIVFFK